ncbi:TRAP transporter small permease [Georgenia phoenicis]|uniref:TRAP transporter small permease n=1 Tax=unclassified Georgenia TaxID=2626815 RepID=UPI0039B05390
MDALKNVLDRVLYWVTVVLFALLVVIVVWQVVSRQVLGDPSTWTEEGARLTFVWLGLFAAAYVFGERGHIAVEILARRFPERGEKVLAVVVQLVVLVFALTVLVWGGWRASQNAWLQELSALPFTLGQMYLALPVAGVLIAFYAVYYVLTIGRGKLPPYGDHSDEEEGAGAGSQPEAARAETLEVDSILLSDTPDTPGDRRADPKTEA